MTVTTQAPASQIGLEQIEAAREVIKGQVVRTPTIAAPKLSELTGAEVYIKFVVETCSSPIPSTTVARW